MATQAEKLAQSLETLTRLRDEGRMAIRSRDLTRTHRERLLGAGFLQEVMKGWYIQSRPEQVRGDSTAWYVSYWGFCADYLRERFGDDWCLSPEQSLLLLAGNHTVPGQLLVRCSRGDNNVVTLPHGTSLFTVRASIPGRPGMEVVNGLRVYSIPAALVAASPDFFAKNEIEARAALTLINNASEVLPVLLDKGHTTIAGRLAGAFENMGRSRIADDIVQTMRAAGHEVRQKDPFTNRRTIPLPIGSGPPHIHRLRLLWSGMRESAISCFPTAPTTPVDIATYLKSVEETFTNDAYHSLSIEGYQVSEELIEQVRSGRWAPDGDGEDVNQRNSLAAKGYWQAHQQVKKSLTRVLDGENPGVVTCEDHGVWYREMFSPSVKAGLIRPSDLAGYRNEPVFISRSRHVPPQSAAVGELMKAYFELLEAEDNPAARVVLGYFVFVFIHPYLDGNGRISRFLMNVMMAAGGYPWVVIPVERRDDYMSSLEKASVAGDIVPFARFLAGLIRTE